MQITFSLRTCSFPAMVETTPTCLATAKATALASAKPHLALPYASTSFLSVFCRNALLNLVKIFLAVL
jgi:hypothetical protein